MSMHKLTAGSGYDYLTRQVAAQDATDKGHTGLASYYTATGETPGQWVGSGMTGIDGLSAGDPVTADQMQALFGSGHHPLATQRRDLLQGPDLSDHNYQAVTRLGLPFKVYSPDVTTFRLEVAQRIATLTTQGGEGNPVDQGSVPAEVRARIRTQVAVEFFRAEHGRDPEDAREIAATIAKHSRPRTTAVAGYDLTFSPVKSVSTLWAVADPATAARIERAHQAAVRDALTFLEQHALFTRTGTHGVRQVNVHGLVATAFTHRDSRAGDPDLHTHVAVANKVQTLDGKWLSIDGRVLFKANVAASETYNTALERHLTADLGLRFEERVSGPGSAPVTAGTAGDSLTGKRAVREIVGVDPRLNERWSQRRASIETRRSQLTKAFQATHGRPPTPVESIQLAQQATLETRDAKKAPRTLAEQRHAWRTQAADVLGADHAVTAMVRTALHTMVTNSAAQGQGPGSLVTSTHATWMQETAATILATLEARRSTWQVWHVRAEALRQLRSHPQTHLPTPTAGGPGAPEHVVDQLVAEVLEHRSVRLSPDGDGITEPPLLRRQDGSSVYTVHGADLYTSARVLAAEQRIVAAGTRLDGHAVPDEAVDLALLEMTANGVPLNAGQAALVRSMATSGHRLQLAIAPAGTGKTTAMRALASAWENGGGTLVGLAPSAAAAAALREQIHPTDHDHDYDYDHSHDHLGSAGSAGSSLRTDTLAKLTWTIEHPHLGDLPPWAHDIGPHTLVVIDEAGMADTISLDTAIEFALARGASVRLIGDDQQLAAIGAGGVLRDLDTTYGALRLSELLRFADPAEGAATLALRDGLPEALGFYLDHGRVHVGDLATLTHDVFTAWQTDRDQALDAIMLAPTRDLVAQLNHRARTHRLQTEHPPGPQEPNHQEAPAPFAACGRSVLLADGNHASAGDLIITRTNDRRLRVSGSDWVKNGDRWTVLEIHEGAQDADHDPGRGDSDPGTDSHARGVGLLVQHARHGRIIHLPAEYVLAFVELGYATTVHGAQGVSVDTVHGLATGTESRQQLYTMLTRGRLTNHVYLQVVGDGDPHTAIHPDTLSPATATDLLHRILARDDSPQSATTTARHLADAATALGHATARYTDALHVAAEQLLGPAADTHLTRTADTLLPGLTDEPAWPTLHAHLVLIAAHGADPSTVLATAVHGRELDTAEDRAAVLDWRLDDDAMRNAGTGPLPWLPAIPAALADHPVWGDYLQGRHARVADLATQVRSAATEQPPSTGGTALSATSVALPVWARQGSSRPAPAVLGDVAVWRAAMQVDPEDGRPTGPPQLQKTAVRWQHHLDRAVTGDRAPALQEWGELLGHVLAPTAAATPGGGRDHHAADAFVPLLAERLAAVSRAGLPAHRLLTTALAEGPLPDDHAAAALWWRLSRHLTPAVATDVRHHLTHPQTLRPDTPHGAQWLTALIDRVGSERADLIQASSWWPALITATDHALQRGWTLPEVLATAPKVDAALGEVAVLVEEDVDPCQAMVWRLSTMTTPPPSAEDLDEERPPDPRNEPGSLDYSGTWKSTAPVSAQRRGAGSPDAVPPTPDDPELRLQLAALTRATMGPLQPSDTLIERQVTHAADLDFAPVPAERMLEINRLTHAFFQQQYPGSWAQRYLTARLGQDPAQHPHLHHYLQPGYAPPGWTTLVTHLRRLGVSDLEMTETGVATLARTGRLIDRFRDRVTMPITHPHNPTHILGFVARRHPDLTEDTPTTTTNTDSTGDAHSQHAGGHRAGPKYLNTADTALFHKGAQLFGLHPDLLNPPPSSQQPGQQGQQGHPGNGATPVLVEGPLDAWAVTLASTGTAHPYLGLAPLGTALTEEQAQQLAHLGHTLGRAPIVATDADHAGHLAAERDFWLLTPHGLDPLTPTLPDGTDPADLLARHGPDALIQALATAQPLGERLLQERLDHLTGHDALTHATQVAAARPAATWRSAAATIASRYQIPPDQATRQLATAVDAWNSDPRSAANAQLAATPHIRDRMATHTAATHPNPTTRWAGLAHHLDPRLPSQSDWPALAAIMTLADRDGYDVTVICHRLVAASPLGHLPAQDLRYRLIAELPLDLGPPTSPTASASPRPRPTSKSSVAERERRADPRLANVRVGPER
ncbi:MobF family relaxase [Dermatophilaceae bacterium Soc4.6]